MRNALALLALATIPSVLAAQTPPQTFRPVADAKVSQLGPTSNLGLDTTLRVKSKPGDSYRSYLRFDLRGMSGPVTSAKLRLFCTDESSTGGRVFALPDRGWSETGITWATQPGPPAFLLADLGSVSANTWVEADVTRAVSAGTMNVFALAVGSSNSAFYSSREGAQPPELVVTTSAGAGGLEVTPAAFNTGGPKGGPFAPSSQVLVLNNTSAGSIAWTATSNVAWLSISQGSGTVAAHAQQQVTASLAAAANTLGTGIHSGKITLRDSTSGLTLFEVGASLGIGTTIDSHAWLNVHGKPFIPIGVWNQPPWQSQVTYLKGLGINTYLNNGLTPPEPTNTQLLDLLAASDMWAILQFDPTVKNHPRLLGWLMGDEPDLTSTPVATVQQNYNAIRTADPEHFIALNTTGNFYWDSNFGNSSVEGLYQGYTAIGDIASFDMYPVTGWDQPGWVYMPGAMTRFLLDRYVHQSKPVWAIVEASDQRLSWTPPGTPGPTPAQMRFEAWDALIHGATAVHYFTIAFNPFAWTNLTPTIEQELARTNRQITALSDIILSAPPALLVTSSEPRGLNRNLMLRKKGASYFLFADNADMGYRSMTITFSFPQPISVVNVQGEARTVVPSGNSFSDTFAPLEVHIYEVRF